MYKFLKILFLFILAVNVLSAQYSVQLAVLKYSGGGDWYANPTALPNLIKFCNENLETNINPEPATVDVGSRELFNYPFVHMTGHGNVMLTNEDIQNLRQYLIGGGFLHVSDNYGLDEFFRREMKKVFPESELIELPFDHPIYKLEYKFSQGLPKIHEHDDKPPQGFGIYYGDRLVCFYDFECDLGDGWEDPLVHKDSEATRTKALEMGANIIQFAFTQ